MNYDYLTSSVQVTIPGFQESKTQPGTIFYTVLLSSKQAKWTMEKRFSQFDALLNGLKLSYHSLPVLPKKSFLFKMNEKDLESRRKGLQQLLQKIVIRNDLLNSQLVKQFLMLDKHASDAMVNPPRLLSEYSIEGATKGIRDFVYIQEKGIYYLVTADVSSVSRLNAKVTNTKLPWQNEGSTKFMEVGSIEAWQSDPISSRFLKIWSKGYPKEAICLSYDPSSKRILVGLDDGVIDFISVAQGQYSDITCVKVHSGRVTGLTYDPLSNIIFSASQDKVFKVNHGGSLAMILGIPHKQPLMSLYKDQLNKRIFIGTKTGQIIIYDVAQAQKPKLLNTIHNNNGGSIRSLFFDNSRNYLFTGSYDDGQLNVFDLDRPGRERLARVTATIIGKSKLRTLTWASKKNEIITGNADGSITFWDALQGKPIFLLKAFDTQVTHIEFLPGKNILISASKNKNIKVWAIPKEWRDASVVSLQDKMNQQKIRMKIRDIVSSNQAKAQEDSDDDDLAGWYRD